MDDLEKIRGWVEEMRKFLEHYDAEKKRPIVYDRSINQEADKPHE